MGKITREELLFIRPGFIDGLFMNANGMLMFLDDELQDVVLNVISVKTLSFISGLIFYARGGLIKRLSSLTNQDHAPTLRKPFAYLVISSFISIRIDLLVLLVWLLIILFSLLSVSSPWLIR